ncbi:peptidase M20A family protein [Gemmatimonas aurantiaca T-27]|uniref:Peptidase M20A family protein n=1 Tax=Gemmatimonas aurantiaca (strain DSM 14586 / JCM 11422 / NBRC 100505 / T-27) TaxID=379066 RepID=C1A5H6_GEMAT|nr:dipeptidase [Gemmatimonas aurantiaca]BAH37486.1 peptidase M20A family protein [Gemmatimonas aurantiaca T-27]
MTSPTIPADLEAWCTANDQRALDELFAFLRIPSVSARSEHKVDCATAAQFVADRLTQIGFTTSVESTPGHPIVVGEWRGAGSDAPTLLIYGHYDVQPAEPLELWTSPAFEPTIRDGRIYARGSVDDKGQLYLHIKALEAHLATRGALPVNVIVLAEGEEEVGSVNLEAFLEREQTRLACDAVVISDSTMFAPGIPSILSSLRGMAYLEITVQGANGDLHSGMYGGAVVNPAMALARILATMHDRDGRIAIPGFYDAVRPFPDHVRAQMRELPFSDEQMMHEVGVTALGGETGYTTLERLWTRPTCEVNGLLSGYTGEGAKTVLPAHAMAKVSFRLVPDQDPAVVASLVDAHVQRVAPAGVTVHVEHLHGGRPWRADLQGPIIEAGKTALEAAFGRAPVITGEGGSIPVVGDFERILGAPVLLMGFGLPGENAHAPNEWISVENYQRGTRAAAALYEEYRRHHHHQS